MHALDGLGRTHFDLDLPSEETPEDWADTSSLTFHRIVQLCRSVATALLLTTSETATESWSLEPLGGLCYLPYVLCLRPYAVYCAVCAVRITLSSCPVVLSCRGCIQNEYAELICSKIQVSQSPNHVLLCTQRHVYVPLRIHVAVCRGARD